MSKNTPITARVSTGLFNKKKGVTEPLLNVGKAGVHGNNQTRDIPSPSKMRGYAMKSSPFKQKVVDGKPMEVKIKGAGDKIVEPKKITKEMTTRANKERSKAKAADTAATSPAKQKMIDGKPVEVKIKSAGQRIIEETPGKPGTANYDKAVAAEGTKQVDPKKITPEMTAKANKKRAEAKAADKAAAKPTKTVKNIPGKVIDLKDFEVEAKRGMVESWEAGSQGRRMKKLSDDISDSQRKVDRYKGRLKGYAKQDEKGNWVKTDPKVSDRKFNRNLRKFQESSRNVKGSQSQYDVYSKGVSRGASGYRGGTFNVTEQATKKSLGDVKQQIGFEQKQLEPKKVVTKTNPLVETPAEKNNKFFKKKTPLKMKYFK